MEEYLFERRWSGIAVTTNFFPNPIYTIWLDDQWGNRICQIKSTMGFEYSKALSAAGWLTLSLPDTFNQNLVQMPDGIIEIWRELEPMPQSVENVFFLRKRKRVNDAGLKMVSIGGPDVMDVIRRRIIAYKAGSLQASMNTYSDDMLKEIIKDNLGDDAIIARKISPYFSVQGNQSLGPTITKGFAFKKLGQVMDEISDTAKQAGTRIYFMIVPYFNSKGILALDFRTYKDYKGLDRSSKGQSPLVFAEDTGNFKNPSFEEDYSEEGNFCYVGGLGEGADRKVVEVSDDERISRSIWNRNEVFKDLNNVSDDNELTAAGQATLQTMRPKFFLNGKIGETEGCRYGRDWDVGYLAVVNAFGLQLDCIINSVKVKVNGDGSEDIGANIDLLDTPIVGGGGAS